MIHLDGNKTLKVELDIKLKQDVAFYWSYQGLFLKVIYWITEAAYIGPYAREDPGPVKWLGGRVSVMTLGPEVCECVTADSHEKVASHLL